MTADKQRAHAPVDRDPADPMSDAVRFLEFLLLDPVDRALATAPVEDEEISEETGRRPLQGVVPATTRTFPSGRPPPTSASLWNRFAACGLPAYRVSSVPLKRD